MSLCDRLRQLRTRACLSTRDLDELSGLGAGHTSMIETGRRGNPTADTSRALAKALGCTVGWLIAGEGAAPSDEEVRAAVRAARERLGSADATGTEG